MGALMVAPHRLVYFDCGFVLEEGLRAGEWFLLGFVHVCEGRYDVFIQKIIEIKYKNMLPIYIYALFIMI